MTIPEFPDTPARRMLAVLVRARQYIAHEDAWTKDVMARDRTGQRYPWPEAPEVAQVCTLGGIHRACYSLLGFFDGDVLYAAERHMLMAARTRQIGPWNDAPRRTHAQVLAAFDRAIAKVEREVRREMGVAA